MQKSYDYVLKFVIVGSSSVGKSSILRRFADDEFEESYISTIGIDFRFKYGWVDAGRCTSRTTT
jgi:Ras-related protein Rab-1A